MRVRGFEIAKGWEGRGIQLPRRGTSGSAGYDLEAAEDLVVPPFRLGTKPTLVPTGLKFYCQPDEFLALYNRSSGAKKGIVLGNGVGIIDADYYGNPTNDGHFQVVIFNISDRDLVIKKGDKIAQAIFQKFALIDEDEPLMNARQGGFGSTDWTKSWRVVYDMDDVLWPLNQRVLKKLGIPLERQTFFDLKRNERLSESEREAILRGFNDVETFVDMDFYPEVAEILDVEDLGVRLEINSNAYTEAIAEQKRQQIKELLPGFLLENLHINLIQEHNQSKEIKEDILVFVDDSPYNIADSAAKINIVPRWPWNISEDARGIMRGSGRKAKLLVENWREALPEALRDDKLYIVYAENLAEVNEIVREAARMMQEEENERG